MGGMDRPTTFSFTGVSMSVKVRLPGGVGGGVRAKSQNHMNNGKEEKISEIQKQDTRLAITNK